MHIQSKIFNLSSLLLVLVVGMLFQGSCKRQPVLSLNNATQNQVIALQPLDDYTVPEIDTIIKNISRFYNKKVILLKSISIPGNFFNPTLKQYAADSLIALLSKLQNDTIVEIIGLTHKPLFTIKNAKPLPYFDEMILGLGYQPGNACIVSDQKLKHVNAQICTDLIKKLIIHEIGHNLGLPHCADEKCIMFKENGDIITLLNCKGDYCNRCRKFLHWPGN
jgi:archaemetzincin